MELNHVLTGLLAEVDTSQGRMYLYQLTAGDVMDQPPEAASQDERTRYFLSRIASLQRREPATTAAPIPDPILRALTDEDFTRIADALRKAFLAEKSKKEREDSAGEMEAKREQESGVAYLSRIIQAELSFQGQALKRVWERAASRGGAIGSAFSALRGSNQDLSRTIREAHLAFSPPREIDTSVFNPVRDLAYRQQAERREEREWQRLTLEMNTKSATALSDLVTTAGTMMAQWEERDVKADKQVRVQLWIAVAALVTSTLLTGLSTYYGYFTKVAYERDVEKAPAAAAAEKAAGEREGRLNQLLEQNAALLQQNADLLGRLAKQPSQPAAPVNRPAVAK